VRMYLREMGSIGLLSRQGEVAIAKRIEGDMEFRFPLAIDTPDYVITDSSGLTATSTPN